MLTGNNMAGPSTTAEFAWKDSLWISWTRDFCIHTESRYVYISLPLVLKCYNMTSSYKK